MCPPLPVQDYLIFPFSSPARCDPAFLQGDIGRSQIQKRSPDETPCLGLWWTRSLSWYTLSARLGYTLTHTLTHMHTHTSRGSLESTCVQKVRENQESSVGARRSLIGTPRNPNLKIRLFLSNRPHNVRIDTEFCPQPCPLHLLTTFLLPHPLFTIDKSRRLLPQRSPDNTQQSASLQRAGLVFPEQLGPPHHKNQGDDNKLPKMKQT